MAEIKVSELQETQTVNNNDLVMILQNGVNKKTKVTNLKTEKNIITVYSAISSETADQNGGIVNFTNYDRVGSKLELNNVTVDNQTFSMITIGSGINHIKVSGCVRCTNFANDNTLIHFYIAKADIHNEGSVLIDEYASSPKQSLHFIEKLVEVQEGETVYICYAAASNQYKIQHGYSDTYLTVEVID